MSENAHEFKVEMVISTVFKPLFSLYFEHFILFCPDNTLMILFRMSNIGTGKTTICKALAQKVYVRNSARYTSGVLLEVNSHSLFSKWFSESGMFR